MTNTEYALAWAEEAARYTEPTIAQSYAVELAIEVHYLRAQVDRLTLELERLQSYAS